jgi:hypothetical protein
MIGHHGPDEVRMTFPVIAASSLPGPVGSRLSVLGRSTGSWTVRTSGPSGSGSRRALERIVVRGDPLPMLEQRAISASLDHPELRGFSRIQWIQVDTDGPFTSERLVMPG